MQWTRDKSNSNMANERIQVKKNIPFDYNQSFHILKEWIQTWKRLQSVEKMQFYCKSREVLKFLFSVESNQSICEKILNGYPSHKSFHQRNQETKVVNKNLITWNEILFFNSSTGLNVILGHSIVALYESKTIHDQSFIAAKDGGEEMNNSLDSTANRSFQHFWKLLSHSYEEDYYIHGRIS